MKRELIIYTFLLVIILVIWELWPECEYFCRLTLAFLPSMAIVAAIYRLFGKPTLAFFFFCMGILGYLGSALVERAFMVWVKQISKDRTQYSRADARYVGANGAEYWAEALVAGFCEESVKFLAITSVVSVWSDPRTPALHGMFFAASLALLENVSYGFLVSRLMIAYRGYVTVPMHVIQGGLNGVGVARGRWWAWLYFVACVASHVGFDAGLMYSRADARYVGANGAEYGAMYLKSTLVLALGGALVMSMGFWLAFELQYLRGPALPVV